MANEQNVFQRVAEATNGVVTPANVIDAAAFAVAMAYAPKMDTTEGIVAVGGSYLADLADGQVARATGTVNELGAAVDAVGDKLKTAYAAYHIANKGLASRSLLGVIAAHNLANAGATAYDRLKHGEPKVVVSEPGKRSVFSNSLGLGLQVIGTKIAETNERRGRQVRLAGAAIGYGGLAVFGIRATRDYWRTARS